MAKRIFLFFSLLVSLISVNSQAQIKVEQKIIRLSQPGTLQRHIMADKWDKTSDLCITGTLNRQDIRALRTLALRNKNIVSIDLANAQEVSVDSTLFKGCRHLYEIILPNNCTEIGAKAFQDCQSLHFIKFPPRIKHIGEAAFKNSGITLAELPEGLLTISQNAFENCVGLKSVILPFSLMAMGERVFCGCENLVKITIPNKIDTIAKEAFKNCISLENVNLQPQVNCIGQEAFANCLKLKNIYLPMGIKSIEQKAFFNCRSVENITLPTSVDTLGTACFSGCKAVTEVKINPESKLSQIPDSCFMDCNSLLWFQVPSGVKKIGVYAFGNCGHMVQLIIPESTDTIGDFALFNCSNLKELITHRSTPPFAGGNTFLNINPSCGITPPPAHERDYLSDEKWKHFPLFKKRH